MRGVNARSAAGAGIAAAMAALAMIPAGAGAAPVDITAPLDCGPLGTADSSAAARMARLPAGSALESEPYVEAAYERALARGEEPTTRRARSAARATGPVHIPVYVHVIHHTNGTGNLSDEEIADQIAVLNDSFNGGPVGGAASQYVFDHISTTRTANTTWFNGMYSSLAVEAAAKGALHQGGARALNLYTASMAVLGYATFPDEYAGNPELDGVVIDYTSLPGNPGVYGLGDTAVHEVGHWLGLFHTFDNGCSPPGDFVEDTPYQLEQNFGCPVGEDSCPSQPGDDPIHNFMDYTDDACMFEFTQGQVDRMDAQTALYRNTPPVAVPASVNVAAGKSVPVALSGTDAEGDGVSFAITDFPEKGTLSGGGANWTYKANAGADGKDSFTYAAVDTLGASSAATVSINVKGDSSVKLQVRAKRRQDVSKLAVSAGCRGESCRVTAGGSISVGAGKAKAQAFRLKRASAKARDGRRAKLRLKVKGGAGKVQSLLEDGSRATAKITVTGKDAAGNKKRSRVSIALTD